MSRTDEQDSHPGARQMSPTATPLTQIAYLLDRQTWTADTLDQIAEVLRSAGFQIRDPEECDQ